MSEYWKSNPRKFCDFCKCWIADNKPSVEFHERGKRHKENVDKRIAEMSKKGQEDWENAQAEEDYLKQMEKNALKAYKNDIEKNPDMTGSKLSEIASANNAVITVKSDKSDKSKSEEKKSSVPPVIKKWYEAKSPEDDTSYYWNTETGEASWDKPSEGFLSLEEQKKIKESKEKREKAKAKKQENTSSFSAAPMVYGPAPRAQIYNSWQTVNKEPEPQIDLGLPELPPQEEYYAPEIDTRSQVSFKEKTVTLSGFSQGTSTGFKKRKGVEEHKKNVRKRNNDL